MTGNGLEHQIGSIPQIKDKLHNNSFQAQFTQLQLQETVFGMRTASRMRTVEGWTSEARCCRTEGHSVNALLTVP